MSSSRARDLLFGTAFWSAWGLLLLAFVLLARWCDGRYYLPFDPPVIRAVQGLDRFAASDWIFGVADVVGGVVLLSVALSVVTVVLIARRLPLEAATMLGAASMRFIQIGVRDHVDRPFLWRTPGPPGNFDQLPDRLVGENSFPSGHVMGEFIVCTLIFAFAPRLIGWRPAIWMIRALCVAEIGLGPIARLYEGAHWPSDVLGGAMLAALYLGAVFWLLARARSWRPARADGQHSRGVNHLTATAERDLVSRA